MLANREEWDDIEWCERNINAASLPDADLVDAASRVHPNSTVLIDLLNEAERRRLSAIVPIARQHLGHCDPFASMSAVSLLQELGDSSDVPRLLELVQNALDHFHLAAILDAIVTLDPARADFALNEATRSRDDQSFDNKYVWASVVVRLAETLPKESPDLERLLLSGAVDDRLSPQQRESIFQRLAGLPRTSRIEDFLVDYCVRDECTDPNLRRIVNDALRGTEPDEH